MGLRGPVGQTATMQIMKGDPRKLGAFKLERKARQEAQACGEPPMPQLSESAQEQWRALVPILLKQKTLSESDGLVLACLCENIVVLRGLRQEQQENGPLMFAGEGYKPILIDHEIAAVERRCLELARELGMSWASRQRNRYTAGDQTPAQDNPWSKM